MALRVLMRFVFRDRMVQSLNSVRQEFSSLMAKARLGIDRRGQSRRLRITPSRRRPNYTRSLGVVFLTGPIVLCRLAAGMLFTTIGAYAQDVQNGGLGSLPIARQFVLGQRPFSSSSSWNTRIAPRSTYTKMNWPLSNGYNYGVAWNSSSPAIYVASISDPLVEVAYPPGWGYAGGSLRIHMPPQADGALGTDGELLVIEGNIVHNFWQFKRLSPTTASAHSYGATNVLTGSGWGRKLPPLGAGIVGAGSSQLAGLLVQAETDQGEIAHALQIAIEFSLAKTGHTGEAISGDGKNPNGIAQEGERLAIPPQAPMPAGLSALGQKVFRAYQEYGAFVIDVAGGVTNLRAQANAYDDARMAALGRDLLKITPILQLVR